MSILKGRQVCIFLMHSLYGVAGSDLLDVSGKKLFLFSAEDFGSFSSSYPISQRNPQMKSNVLLLYLVKNSDSSVYQQSFSTIVAGRIDRWVDTMVEGGLRPHWIKKTLYLKGLKNIHAQRIQNAASGNNTQGIVLDRNMFWYPLLLLCGCLFGSSLVWVVELVFLAVYTNICKILFHILAATGGNGS